MSITMVLMWARTQWSISEATPWRVERRSRLAVPSTQRTRPSRPACWATARATPSGGARSSGAAWSGAERPNSRMAAERTETVTSCSARRDPRPRLNCLPENMILGKGTAYSGGMPDRHKNAGNPRPLTTLECPLRHGVYTSMPHAVGADDHTGGREPGHQLVQDHCPRKNHVGAFGIEPRHPAAELLR